MASDNYAYLQGRHDGYEYELALKAWEMRDTTMPGDTPPVEPENPFTRDKWPNALPIAHRGLREKELAYQDGITDGRDKARREITRRR